MSAGDFLTPVQLSAQDTSELQVPATVCRALALQRHWKNVPTLLLPGRGGKETAQVSSAL